MNKQECNIRSNSVLSFIKELNDVVSYKIILKEFNEDSVLSVVSGIVKINNGVTYIGYEFVPFIKYGCTFKELCTVLRFKIISFEHSYGDVIITNADSTSKLLSEEDRLSIEESGYYFNVLCHKSEYANKELIHLEQSSEVLHYLLCGSVLLKNITNGWCSLMFKENMHLVKEYCTIFSYEQIKVLEKLNNMIYNKNIFVSL